MVSRWCSTPPKHPARTTTAAEEKDAPTRLGPKTSKKGVTSTRVRGDNINNYNNQDLGLELLPGGSGLGPTPGESVDWVERMQSFPTEGRPQHVMASTNMGTISCAEALQRTRASLDSQEEQREVVANGGGILVVTEVWREILPDPNYRPAESGGSRLTETEEDLGSQSDRGDDVVLASQEV